MHSCLSRVRRASGSLKRAVAHTSLPSAMASVTGSATCPVAPATSIFCDWSTVVTVTEFEPPGTRDRQAAVGSVIVTAGRARGRQCRKPGRRATGVGGATTTSAGRSTCSHPEVIKAAAGSITTGKVYSLGIPIQGQGVPLLDYRGTPMRLTLQDSTDDGIYADYGCQKGTGAHEDVLVMASHTTSHMDALVHVYGDYQHYNGVPHDTMRALAVPQQARHREGRRASPPGRVLLDMVALLRRRRRRSASVATSPPTTSRARPPPGRRGAGGRRRAGPHRLPAVVVREQRDRRPPTVRAGRHRRRRRPLAGARTSWPSVATTPPSRSSRSTRTTTSCTCTRSCSCSTASTCSSSSTCRAGRRRVYEGVLAVAPLKVTGATGSPINPIFIA